VSLFKKIKSIKSFFSGASPHTIAAMLNVPIQKVIDWQNGHDSPSKNQAKLIKKISSPLLRLKRALSHKLSLILKKYFLLVSANTIYPYRQDRGLLTNYLSTFLQNPRFLDAYAKGIEIQNHDPKSHNRIHQSIWATSISIKNEGDWVELGTGRGFTMSATLKYHKEKWNQSSKNLWLVDTFSPFAIDLSTGTQNQTGAELGPYCDDLDKVKGHFKEFHNVHFLQGLVPECLDRLEVEKISFLHIDLNSPKPEIAALSLLWDRLVKGGILLLDDYGGPSRKDQHDAMNDFALRHSFEILQMPSGQGLAIKNNS
jgi:O-methyltransferase